MIQQLESDIGFYFFLSVQGEIFFMIIIMVKYLHKTLLSYFMINRTLIIHLVQLITNKYVFRMYERIWLVRGLGRL